MTTSINPPKIVTPRDMPPGAGGGQPGRLSFAASTVSSTVFLAASFTFCVASVALSIAFLTHSLRISYTPIESWLIVEI